MTWIWWAGKGVVVAVLLAGASYCDIRSRTVPDVYSALILLVALFTPDIEKWLGIFCAMPFLVAALTSGGIGGADIKIMGTAGMVLGFLEGISAIILGLSGMLIFHIVKHWLKKRPEKETSYPLIPFLAVGIMIVYLTQQP